MKVTDKKQYIAPQTRTNRLNANALLAGSDVTSGGNNDQPGAPTEAESKRSSIWSFDNSGDE